MSLETALGRIAQLNTFLAGPTAAPATTTTAPPTTTTTTAVPSSDQFAQMLRTASVAPPTSALALTTTSTGAAGTIAPAAAPTGNSAAARMVAMAQGEVGQAEQPPGSNNSPRIAQYRSATAGAPGPGPWCAYFVSWLARNAGVPVGDHGQGFGSVDALYAWAQKSGRAVPASSGQNPKPGDLIVWDEHIGMVEAVRPDGSIQTIEGNSSDRVSRRVHQKGDAIGYVRMS
jgi:CHAP domain